MDEFIVRYFFRRAGYEIELAPLLKVPLAKRGEPIGRGSPCLQGEPKGGGFTKTTAPQTGGLGLDR